MRATFFALSALPLYAFAQDPAPTSADAIVAPETTTELPLVEESTTLEAIDEGTPAQVLPIPDTTTGLAIVVDSSTLPAPIVDTTTSPLPLVDTTTGTAPVIDTTAVAQDTTTEPLVQDTTTEPAVIDTTTGQPPIVDASTGSDLTQPIVQDTTTQPNVESTPTEQPVVADTTTEQQPPVQPTTTELEPPNVDTTTWLPVVDTSEQLINQTPGTQVPSSDPVDHDTTTEQQPPVDSTTTGAPDIETTTGAPDIETTTGVPDVETTTGVPDVETTTGAPDVETTTNVPPVETTTNVPPVETTTQQAVQDTTTAEQPVETTEESKPSTKDDEPAITQPPTTTAAAAADATASVSSVSSQVAALVPIINKWTDDPESLTDETNKEVEDTHDDIIAVIVGLGGKPDVACNKKRGLLGPIGDVINKLACMAQDLTNISTNIVAGNVPAVTSVVPQVQSQNDDLTEEEEEENKSDEDKESTKQESTKKESTTEKVTSTEESTTEKPTSTEETTTTEATTTTTGDTIVCESGSCGGGSCPIGLGSGGSMPDRMRTMSRDINCEDVPTTTIDGPLPTGPISVGSSKRDNLLQARVFLDDSTPNPDYIMELSMNVNTVWDDQMELTTGHFVGAPLDYGWAAAGVNGIYGCTAVLVVSNLGVYTSHIWEIPGFLDVNKMPTSDDFFETNVINVLRDGAENPVTVAQTAKGVKGLTGTDDAPGPLHSQFDPHVFIVTPYNTAPDNPSRFRYGERANLLLEKVSGSISGAVAGGVLGYWPWNGEVSTGPGFLGRTVVEFDMFDGLIASQVDPGKLQTLGRWRFWVEDKLLATHSFNIYEDFFDYAGAEAGVPSNGNQKRAEDDPVQQCLIRESTATTSAGPTSTDDTTTSDASSTEEATSSDASSTEEVATTSDATSATETTADSTTNGETTETVGTTTEDKTTGATTTQSDTSLPTSTLSTLVTTTRASSDAVTSDLTSDASTTEEARTSYPCFIYGGPRVSSAYCQCSTTVSGELYVTSAPMIDHSCADYTSYPSPVIPVTDA
ncbi:hypothetical protein FSARC_7248, partial [Fusarium sarcochroum]